ncbi:MAG: 4Fe-4S dicluster domain-containing protein, partial [Oscillospiraceae bacterium]|nr:4Fe-4S dicluster domain-containing protein [Oscillospiraceae bacterium]
NDFIKTVVDEGIFETITAPFHLMDNSRLDGLLYAMSKKVAPVAMNPLAGGTLADSEKSADLVDLALRYITSYGISALAGMSNIEQAKINIEIMKKPALTTEQAESMRTRFLNLVDATEFKCASCGYCMPCPAEIDVPEIFKRWNQVKVLGLIESSEALSEISGKIGGCTRCGSCESKCPNKLEIIKMLDYLKN